MKGYASDLPIGELLVKAGLVSQNQIDDAVKDSGTRDRLIGRTLINRGYISPEQLRAALQAQSLIRDGAIDTYSAFKALSTACAAGLTFEEALNSVSVNSNRAIVLKSRAETCKLGELLLAAGAVTPEIMQSASVATVESGYPLGFHLVSTGVLSESYLDAALELQIRVRDGMFSREQAVEALKQDPRKFLDMVSPDAAFTVTTATGGRSFESQTFEREAFDSRLLKPLVKKGENTIRLGELFVRAGILGQNDINQALELSLAHGHPIGEMLVARGFITRALLDAALGLQTMVKNLQLTAGEATACMVKVFNSDKTVSECILELNLVKSQPATELKIGLPPQITAGELNGYFKKAEKRATMTVNELPAMTPQRLEETLQAMGGRYLERKHKEQAQAGEGLTETAPEAEFAPPKTAEDTNNTLAQPPAITPGQTASTLERHSDESLRAEFERLSAELFRTESSDDKEEVVEYTDLFPATGAYKYEPADRQEFFSALHDAHSRLGKVFLKRGDLLAAEELLEESLAISQTFQLESNLLNDLSFLACHHLKTGKSWQSEKLLKRCLLLLETRGDRGDALQGLVYHRLALVYCHLGLLFKAEKHFKKAAEYMQTASLRGYLLLSSNEGEQCTLGSLLKRRLAAIYKDHGVLLSRMRRESEADRYYCLSRKTLSDAIMPTKR
ncbi:MAG: hypothetical protein SFV17_11635 [Candidatus Obscuribacter sp.]|nr:hypothetical protein [Candidatus Obscuribacter sp.]